MGHITRYGIKIDTSDFRKFWHGTVAYNRDGCSSIYIIPFHKGKCTDSVIKRFFKQKENRSDPNSYCVNAYDCGIKGYEAVRVVSRIVNHKRTKVQEVKEYKSKPARVLKGVSLREIHTFIVDYDYRDYDPLEHGGFCI